MSNTAVSFKQFNQLGRRWSWVQNSSQVALSTQLHSQSECGEALCQSVNGNLCARIEIYSNHIHTVAGASATWFLHRSLISYDKTVGLLFGEFAPIKYTLTVMVFGSTWRQVGHRPSTEDMLCLKFSERDYSK